MGEVITVPYKPRNWALALHSSYKRFGALLLHRRAGKTTAVLNHHLRAALDDDWERERLRFLKPNLTESQLKELIRPPGGRHYGHIMPLRTQAKLVAWDKLKFYARVIKGVKFNESELLVRLPNGNKVQLFGADDPDAFRGFAGSGLSFDEYSQQPRNIFSEVLSKALGDHLGYALFVGTVKGKDHLWNTYSVAKDDPEWFALWQDIDRSLSTEEGVTIQMLGQAMEDDRKMVLQGLMTQAEFDQEWYLSLDAAIKGAIYAPQLSEARKQGRITSVSHDPALPVDTDWDIGYRDSTAIWFSQSLHSGEVRLIDYYEATEEAFPHYAALLKQRSAERGYVYGTHWGPHDIVAHSYQTGKTLIDTARTHGVVFTPTPRLRKGTKGELEDGINAVRLLLPRCWFDEKKCDAGLEALRHYRRDFNKRLDEFKPEPIHDWASHGADAFRGLSVRHQTPIREKQERAERVALPQNWSWS